MEKPSSSETQFHVSPVKAALIAVVVLGGISLGTWFTLPKMDERGRSQERYGRMRIESSAEAGTASSQQKASAAALILDGDFVWIAAEGDGGFWLGRYTVDRGEFETFARTTGLKFNTQPGDAGAGGRSEARVPVEAGKLYCDWSTRASGIAHRLPTEAEWDRWVNTADGNARAANVANASGIYPSLTREWVTSSDGPPGGVTLRPAGGADETGAFRVVRSGPAPVR